MVNVRHLAVWIEARLFLWLLFSTNLNMAQLHYDWTRMTEVPVSSNFRHPGNSIASSNKAMMTSMIQSLEAMAKVKQDLQNSQQILPAISSISALSSTPPPLSYWNLPAAIVTDPPPTWQLPAPMPTVSAVWALPTFSPLPTHPAQHWAIRHHTRPMVTMTTTMRPMRARRPRNPWTALLSLSSLTLTRLFGIVLREMTRLVSIAAQTFVGLVAIAVGAAVSLIMAAIWRTLEIFTKLLGMVLVALIRAIAVIIAVYIILQYWNRVSGTSLLPSRRSLFKLSPTQSAPVLKSKKNLTYHLEQNQTVVSMEVK